MSDKGYVNYFEVLGLKETANPGEVRKTYRRLMKRLVGEIAQAQITEERRAHFLLEMAKQNAALYVLRDRTKRERYWNARQDLIDLEERWRLAAETDHEEAETCRKLFDGKVRDFLSHYVEEATLEAGRDKECVESSHWDAAHERHASSLLRHYRHRLYQDILERLPYHEVTRPEIDWDERARAIEGLVAKAAAR